MDRWYGNLFSERVHIRTPCKKRSKDQKTKTACGGKDSSGKKSEVNESSKIKAFKKIIDGLIFAKPRQIPFIFDGQVGSCQRPLRAQTAQGERIAIANSETVPAGAYIDVEIILLNSEYEAAVIEWLDYGALRGIGCWRNASKGRFEYRIMD